MASISCIIFCLITLFFFVFLPPSKNLAVAITQLPALTERKRTIDMHMNMAVSLMNTVKERALDEFHGIEENIRKKVNRGRRRERGEDWGRKPNHYFLLAQGGYTCTFAGPGKINWWQDSFIHCVLYESDGWWGWSRKRYGCCISSRMEWQWWYLVWLHQKVRWGVL